MSMQGAVDVGSSGRWRTVVAAVIVVVSLTTLFVSRTDESERKHRETLPTKLLLHVPSKLPTPDAGAPRASNPPASTGEVTLDAAVKPGGITPAKASTRRVVNNDAAADLYRLEIDGIALDEPDHSSFAFGPIPTHARRYGRNTASSRTTGVPCVCTNASCFSGDQFLACAHRFTVRDERTADELAEVLVNRTRRVVQWWRRKHGGIPAERVGAAVLDRHVIIFFSPPTVTLITSALVTQHPARARFFAEDWARLAALPNVVAWFRRRFPGREGFLVISSHDDFSDETLPHFSTYSTGEALGTKHFMMFDRFLTMRNKARKHMQPHISNRYDVLAQSLYGSDITYEAPAGPWEASPRFNTWLVKPSAARSPADDTWEDLSSTTPEPGLQPGVEAGEADLAAAREVPWQDRQKRIYFRGAQTRSVRTYVAEVFLNARGANVSDVDIPERMSAKAHQPLTRMLQYRMNLALRGQTAAQRDRMLLLSGSAIVRVVSLEREPSMIQHQLMHPWVHFVPLVYFSRFSSKSKSGLRFLSNGIGEVLSRLLNDGDEQLQLMAANVRRLGKIYASRVWRDQVMAESIALYAEALSGDGHPTTLEEAKAFVDKYNTVNKAIRTSKDAASPPPKKSAAQPRTKGKL